MKKSISQKTASDGSAAARSIYITEVDLKEGSRAQLAAIVESAADAIYAYDFEGRILAWNRSAEALFGYEATEIVGRPVTDLMSPQFEHEPQAIISAIESGETVVTFETRRRRKDGTEFAVRLTGSPIKDEHGRHRAVSIIAHDITARKAAEQALRESEERSRLATEATSVGIWEWNLLTDKVRWDNQMFRIYGIEPTKDGFVPYSAWSSSVVAEDLAQQEALLQETLRDRKDGNRVFRIRRSDTGEVRYIHAVETVRVNSAGDVEWIIGTNLDITERREVEEKLRASEARFRRVLAQSNAGIVQTDASGQMTLVNGRWCEMLGYGEDEFLSMGILEITDESSVEETLAAVGRLAAGGPDFEIEKNYRRKDGSIMSALSKVSALRGNEGEYQGLVAVVIDMTERLKADAERSKLTAIIESSSDAILSKDFDGTILSWNRAAQEIFGYSAEEAIGKNITMLFPPERLDEEKTIMASVKSGRTYTDYETIRRRKDGSNFPVGLTVSPIKDKRGTIVGISKIVRDITERKNAEILLRKSERLEIEAELREAERNRIARDLHDHLGQQLTGLRLQLTNLKSSCGEESGFAQQVDGLIDQAQALDRDLSQLAFELRSPLRGHVSLGQALENLVAGWSSTSQVPAECRIECDTTQQLSRQLETNLYRIAQEALNNTAKYANAKMVNVLLRVRDGTVKLIIEDDGIGFDREKRTKGSKETGGGLGLLGMNERAALLGGTVEIESQPGRGTAIFVTVPLSFEN